MKIPINRIVAFAGPHISIFAGGVAAWLVARVDVLGIPGLNQPNTATWIAGALSFALTASLTWLGHQSWLEGHHIELEPSADWRSGNHFDSCTISNMGSVPTSTAGADGASSDAHSHFETVSNDYKISAVPAEAPADEGPGDHAHPLFDDIPLTDPLHLSPDFDDSTVQEHRGGGENAEHFFGSSAVSGLSDAHRSTVRNAIMKAVALSFKHSSSIGYTQGSDRWLWKPKDLFASLGKFPTNLDCSAWATWVLYQGLRLFHIRDLVNGEGWLAGYTGTMLSHGKVVKHEENIKYGDLAIYNGHVAVCIGGGLVASHGSPGIHKLPLHYRGDLICVRRYI